MVSNEDTCLPSTPQNADMMITMMTDNDNDNDDDYYKGRHLGMPDEFVPVYAPVHPMRSWSMLTIVPQRTNLAKGVRV